MIQEGQITLFAFPQTDQAAPPLTSSKVTCQMQVETDLAHPGDYYKRAEFLPYCSVARVDLFLWSLC